MRSAGDLVLAGVLALLGVATAPLIDGFSQVDARVDTLAVALILAAAAPLWVRHRWPEVVLVAVGAATSVYLIVGYPYGPILFSLAVAVYTLASHRPLATAAAWSLGIGVAVLVHVFTNEAALPGLLGLAPGSAWIVVPFAVGTVRRVVNEAADRERADAQRRLLDDERVRVAQEVHDIVGHGLAAIQMQADIALHLRERKPDQSLVALDAISRTSADALSELHVTLGALGRAPADDDHRAPTPGLERIDELCRRMARAGVTVALSVVGDRRPLPAAADVAAYRVVQETLTNVVKHASHRHADVLVEFTAEGVTLRVRNQAAGQSAPRPGMGISGMRRRVEALGGRFSAGPGEPGVFEVVAWLPAAASP